MLLGCSNAYDTSPIRLSGKSEFPALCKFAEKHEIGLNASLEDNARSVYNTRFLGNSSPRPMRLCRVAAKEVDR